jgi:hypothetical protein
MKPEIEIPDCYRQIRANGVKRYLLGQGWNLRSDSRPGFLWFDGVDDADGKPIDLVLPENEGAPDYERLLRLMIVALCHIERRGAEEIVENLIAHDPSSMAAG